MDFIIYIEILIFNTQILFLIEYRNIENGSLYSIIDNSKHFTDCVY